VLFLFLDMSNVEAHDLLATYGVKQFVGNWFDIFICCQLLFFLSINVVLWHYNIYGISKLCPAFCEKRCHKFPYM
jgi:hypothetical protein